MDNANEKLTRVKKSCRIGRTACNVLKIICLIGAIGALVGFVMVMVARGQVNTDGYSSLIEDEDPEVATWEISNDDLRSVGIFAELIPASADDLLKIALVSLFSAVTAGLAALLFHIFGQVFYAILNGESPFTEDILKKLKIDFILISLILLFSVGLGSAVVAAFLFWCLYNIFDYGCVLQRDADETL